MKDHYRKMKNLFLKQSYNDDWEDYQRSLRKESFPRWDYIIVTASNEEQADSYQEQIRYRMENGLLPQKTNFIVIPDLEGRRIGSGGATLNVLRYIAERENNIHCFEKNRILVIHSGGDSKRIPQYSACGKLFSPVPRELPDGRVSTLFDEFIISMSGLAGRIKNGMLVLSGDVLLLFNPLQIDYQFADATAISMVESVDTGKNHGVFLVDEQNYVKQFLHKKSVPELNKLGAVDNHDCVHIDTGAIILGPPILNSLLGLIVSENAIDEAKFRKFVNEKARISFYGDFIYPFGINSTLEDYLMQDTEGERNEEILSCRKKIWDALTGYRMVLTSPSPAEFIHFGTTKELLHLLISDIENYECLGWKSQVFSYGASATNFAMNTSAITEQSTVGSNSYLENTILKGNCIVGSNTILSSIGLENVTVPDNIVIHCLKLKSDKYVARIYGTDDNPKSNLLKDGTLFGKSVSSMLLPYKNLIWSGEDTSLWTASLYPASETVQEAYENCMLLYKTVCSGGNPEQLKDILGKKCYSLHNSFNLSDSGATMSWRKNVENLVLTEKFVQALNNQVYYDDALSIFGNIGINPEQYQILMERAQNAPLAEKIRIYYAISRYMKRAKKEFHHQQYDALENMCFKSICDSLCDNALEGLEKKEYKIQKNLVNIRLPVRVNWGGGWTDTPPYCLEKGGVVLNAAVTINGKYPIQVTLEKINRPIVIFESIDTGAYEEIETAKDIQHCYDPSDAVALHKAALLACGLIPAKSKCSLQKILKNIGGGVRLCTQVENIPKGSGLGTSSILAIACIKGIYEFLGEEKSDSDLCDTVLRMEQIMSTGGGWQDQVGGLTPGIKFATSKPGIQQKISIEKVEIPENVLSELNERFALIYTGQRRLARNILRDVVGSYIGNRPESLNALERMKRVCVLMKFELEQGNIDNFAELLNEHWELSKQLDMGSTNSCINQIWYVCEDLIDGRFIAGAGGGGFLQVILKRGVTPNDLRKRLHEVFFSSGVEVWDCNLITK